MNPPVLNDFSSDGKNKFERERRQRWTLDTNQLVPSPETDFNTFTSANSHQEPGIILKILFEKNKIPDSCQTTKTKVYVPGKDAFSPDRRDYCTVGAHRTTYKARTYTEKATVNVSPRSATL